LELNNKPMWTNVANIPSFVPKAASVPVGSRNRTTYVPALFLLVDHFLLVGKIMLLNQ
ncbi:hypothetical protein Tco_0579912, partial [Tanacetum coccineum]